MKTENKEWAEEQFEETIIETTESKKADEKRQRVILAVLLVQGLAIILLASSFLLHVQMSNKVNTQREIDYNKIEAIVEKYVTEQSESAEVDYDKIEAIVEENQANVEKDFGEKFEEMTTYFGDKFKGLVSDVNEKLNKTE